MRNFSDELAKRGLGLGIYTAHGALTCQRYPGSLGHEVQDAALYEAWNVSFVKNGG
jgi:alpha-galactosidase